MGYLAYNGQVLTFEGQRLWTGLNASIGRDLSLNATSVTWIDETHIQVVYNWDNDNQINDFIATSGTTLSRDATLNSMRITNGALSIRAAKWIQPIKCSRIYAVGVISLSGGSEHVNFYSDLSTNWIGTPYNPNPGLAAVWNNARGFVSVAGTTHTSYATGNLPTPNVSENYDFIVNDGQVECYAENQDTSVRWFENISSRRHTYGIIAIGAYQTNTIWGQLIIEGEVDP